MRAGDSVMSFSFVIDTVWMRATDGAGVLAGSPLTFFRVTESGARVLDLLERGEHLPDGHQPLTDRLLAAGAIHPVPTSPARTTDVTVVIPSHARSAAHAARVARVSAALSPLTVIVVDDASPVAIEPPGPDDSRVTVVRLESNSGPAAARNAGLAHVATPAVAFIDDDVDISVESILLLASLVSAGVCDAAAPRVASRPSSHAGDLSAIEEYETFHSPLDLGTAPALVRPDSRVPYVPSAALVMRTDAVAAVGRFDESMRVGEDVDLVWRLVESGLSCRYVPAIVCSHEPRPTLRSLVTQRQQYGSSAARLEYLHPGSAPPFRGHLMMALPALALLGGFPFAAIPLSLVVIIGFSYAFAKVPVAMTTRWRLAVESLFHTTRLLASAIRRTWWPVVAALAVVSRAAQVALLVSIFVPGAWGIARKAPRRALSYLGLRIVDDLGYGVGVWRGAFSARSVRCLLPVVSVRRSTAR